MAKFDPDAYGPLAAGFLLRQRPQDELDRYSAVDLFAAAPLANEALAGLWLYFDDLDRSHSLSQNLSSREAAFWHGIMHRREPDPGNAGYWFRRVGRHAVFPALAAAAKEVGFEPRGSNGDWDPFAWIDYWEEARRQPGSAQHRVALQVQRVEWEILFDYCAKP